MVSCVPGSRDCQAASGARAVSRQGRRWVRLGRGGPLGSLAAIARTGPAARAPATAAVAVAVQIPCHEEDADGEADEVDHWLAAFPRDFNHSRIRRFSRSVSWAFSASPANETRAWTGGWTEIEKILWARSKMQQI